MKPSRHDERKGKNGYYVSLGSSPASRFAVEAFGLLQTVA